MRYIKDIIISIKEPPVNNVAWLQPQSNGTYRLYVYGSAGWVPLTSDSTGGIGSEFIQDIPDIIIKK